MQPAPTCEGSPPAESPTSRRSPASRPEEAWRGSPPELQRCSPQLSLRPPQPTARQWRGQTLPRPRRPRREPRQLPGLPARGPAAGRTRHVKAARSEDRRSPADRSSPEPRSTRTGRSDRPRRSGRRFPQRTLRLRALRASPRSSRGGQAWPYIRTAPESRPSCRRPAPSRQRTPHPPWVRERRCPWVRRDRRLGVVRSRRGARGRTRTAAARARRRATSTRARRRREARTHR
jgi:hypothetical protein